jgi:hypothetical protein
MSGGAITMKNWNYLSLRMFGQEYAVKKKIDT